MQISKLLRLFIGVMLLGLLLAACAPAATPEATPEETEAPVETEAPEETEAPAETEAPTEAPTEAATEKPVDMAPTSVGGECGDTTVIESVEATDASTVVFNLCRPDPAFPQKLAFASFAMQSPEWIAETGGSGELLDRSVGTGPYMIEDGGWARGESITFTRFDGYWGDAALSQTLVFRWSSEAAARLLELQSGTVDGIDNPSPDDFATIEGDPNLQLLNRPALNVFYVAFTPVGDGSPFDDVKVRQAIAMGIDRQEIVDTFYPEGSEVASHFTPCAIDNGCVGDPWYDFDPEGALALLEEAGYGDGFPEPVNIYYRDVVRSYLPEVTQVAQNIQAQLLENLGLETEIVVMESGEFIDKATSGQLSDGIHLLGWGADYPQITNFLDYHFNQNNPQFGTAHEEIYGPLLEGAAIADPAEAEPFYVEANNAIKELVPMIPIAHGASAVAYKADVVGAHTSPLGNEFFAVMQPGDRDTFVWMQNAEPISLQCADETDGESLRACEQVTEPLLAYEHGGTDVVPNLATECTPNDDLTVWTCALREGVTFHDGTTFEATDVIFNFAYILDASHPYHVGNTGSFDYPAYFFGLWNQPSE